MVTYSCSTGEALQIFDITSESFVFLHSMSGHRLNFHSPTHFYSATKYAVTALTEGLRQELREMKSGIKVTVNPHPHAESHLYCHKITCSVSIHVFTGIVCMCIWYSYRPCLQVLYVLSFLQE